MLFYMKLISNVCIGGKCSKDIQQSCWDVTTGVLKVMLDDINTVRVHAAKAHLMKDPEGMGMFLHATL